MAAAVWLFVGVLVGALGFVMGASLFPDTNVGLWLGAVVPTLINALLTFWTKRVDYFLAATIGAGALSGVYANVFNLDPQGLNVSLLIALGQTILPLGLGFFCAVFVRVFLGDGSETAVAPPEPADTDQTQLIDVEVAR